MELRQLHYFVTVADTLSFSRAAESLFVSQPTLSNQISDLERELGVKLLERTKRTVNLTEAGATFLRDAKDLLRQADRMKSVRSGSPAVEAPRLNIGFTPEGMDCDLVCQAAIKTIRQFREESPEGNYFFRECEDTELDAALKRNDVVIDIWKYQDSLPMMNSFLLSRTKFVLVTGAELPPLESREDLARLLGEREVFLSQEKPNRLGEIFGLFAALQASPKIRYRKSGDSIRMQVLSGDGIMVTPQDEMRQYAYLPGVHIISLDLPQAQLCRGIRWHESNMNPLIQTFCNSMKENYDALLAGEDRAAERNRKSADSCVES